MSGETGKTGLIGYQGVEGRSGPRRVLAKLQEKCRLRAALAAVQADLDSALRGLNASELVELQGLMASEIQMADDDAAALARQVQEEAQLAETTKPLQVRISRRAAAALAAEAERRLERGVFRASKPLRARRYNLPSVEVEPRPAAPEPLNKEGTMELMTIARRVQKNLKRVGVTAKIEVEGGVVFVRGVDRKGEPFNIRVRTIAFDARGRSAGHC
jgi:hypothetical protein